MSSPQSWESDLLGLAHELKNCLLVVQGSAGLIQTPIPDPRAVAELADDIGQAARRASEIVSELQRSLVRRRTASLGSAGDD